MRNIGTSALLLIALAAGCNGADAPTEPRGPILVQYQWVQQATNPRVTVTPIQQGVVVTGDFLAGCSMGPFPQATADDDGDAIRILVRDDNPGPCVEGYGAARYVATLGLTTYGARRVIVTHRGDRYRGAGIATVTVADTVVVVFGPD